MFLEEKINQVFLLCVIKVLDLEMAAGSRSINGILMLSHTYNQESRNLLSLELFVFVFNFKAPGPKLTFPRHHDFHLGADSKYSSSFLTFLLEEEEQYSSIPNKFTNFLRLYF